jgi:hypothetical protein
VSARQRGNDQPHDVAVPSGRAQRGAPPKDRSSPVKHPGGAPREHGLGGDRPPTAQRAPDEGRHPLGVNAEGAALIVELLDRIDLLEQRLRHFEAR